MDFVRKLEAGRGTNKGILTLENNFDVFLFDAYGVLWDGSKLYDGVQETMEKLVKDGKTVVILSNATQTSEVAEDSYRRKGLVKGQHYGLMVTSGAACKDVLLKDGLEFRSGLKPKKVFQFGTPNSKLFEGTECKTVSSLEEAECVYISIPQFTEEQYARLSEKYADCLFESMLPKEGEPRKWDSTSIEPFKEGLELILSSGKPVFGCNPDLRASEGVKGRPNEKNFVVRQGMIAEYLRSRRAEVVEFGKPYVGIYDFTFGLLEKSGISVSNKSKICMIGDTLMTDGQGANNAGVKFVLCTETGVTADKVIREGKNLEDLIRASKVVVDYAISSVAHTREISTGCCSI